MSHTNLNMRFRPPIGGRQSVDKGPVFFAMGEKHLRNFTESEQIPQNINAVA